MLIVHVSIEVKQEYLDAFIEATKANASASKQEPGVARFDFLQSREDQTAFTLVEVYRDEIAAGDHKTTSHYLIWRETVADMMARPRSSVKFTNILPSDRGWM